MAAFKTGRPVYIQTTRFNLQYKSSAVGVGPLLRFREPFLTGVCCGVSGGRPAFLKENVVSPLHHNEKREENDGLPHRPCLFIALSVCP